VSAALLLVGLWFAPSAPALAGLFAALAQGATDFSRERAMRRAVSEAFGRYLSPALVERLAADPSSLRLGGEKREVSILFCDLRGFTVLSEAMKDDPEGLTRLVNRALTPLGDAILERGGAIDKFIGDCVMGLWNAPVAAPDHAAGAIDAAIAMVRAIDTLAEVVAAEARAAGRALPRLACGVGVNSGVCVVGNMGTARRFDYTAMGDAVNLAARLEGRTKAYGVKSSSARTPPWRREERGSSSSTVSR
jgi:adenylate cyclase